MKANKLITLCVGLFFLLMAPVLYLLGGWTGRSGGYVSRETDPFAFWGCIILMGAVGMLFLLRAYHVKDKG